MSARLTAKTQQPWNKGLLVGQKKPLEPKHVWSIRVRLELAGSKRDLAIFNLAIDSKLRACDLVKLRLDDVCFGIESAKPSNNRPKEDRATSTIRNHGTIKDLSRSLPSKTPIYRLAFSFSKPPSRKVFTYPPANMPD